MGWSNMEEETTKKGMLTSSTLLLAIIVCVVLMIIVICMLLMSSVGEDVSSTISVDGQPVNVKETTLIGTIDNIVYVNIEEFAKLVGYEYHFGEEYKAFKKDENKCYVQGKYETASFFDNERKVLKLPVNQLTSDYNEFVIDNPVKKINGKMYAPINSIGLAFNVYVKYDSKNLTIMTLDYLVKLYDAEVRNIGYTGIADQTFENQKALLYGCLIVKKENSLYKIINTNDKKEIVSDKYILINFTEVTKEFFVTNSLGQVGIINIDGTTKVEPIYDSMSILDKESDLYLIEKNDKYGVVKSGNTVIINPEYDKIGLGDIEIDIEKHSLILNKIIPVFKDNKWGAYDKTGKLVLQIEYDKLGCEATTAEVNGTKVNVSPVFIIERCNGIVVEKNKKYGVVNLKGEILVPIAVDKIYAYDNIKNEDMRYYMLYNNNELNIIERLVEAKLIEGPFNSEIEKEEIKEDNNILENANTNTIETSVSVTDSTTNRITENVTTNSIN